METIKYDSIISEILKTCSEIDNNNEKYDGFINLFCSLLNEIYSNGFRHKYSNISSTIFTILNESENPDKTSKNILSNLDVIKGKIGENFRQYDKLYDHVSLEIQHFTNIYSNSNIELLEKHESSLNEISKDIKSATEKNEDINSKIEKIYKETENLNNQLVSILGIFTGIIIAFFGGVSIISDALKNIHLVNRFKLIFVITLTGFIVFNIVTSLMLSVGKIINKNLQSTMCVNSQNCDSCNICSNKKGKKNKLKIFIKKYPFIIFINTIFFIIMLLDVIAWLLNISQIK
ncbi:MAG: hypothetical protein NC320_03670 [Clostridium sp.]|nr:hypothetical protein [Clostridium sp.]MCM1547214.1 hypothetical protein [Ruminococcus sp.]